MKYLSAFAILSILWLKVPPAHDVLASPINLTKGAAATIELINLQKAILAARTLDDKYPDKDRVRQIVKEGFSSNLKNPALDFWGRPYLYTWDDHGFELRCAGPDKAYYNDDDLTLTWRDSGHE